MYLDFNFLSIAVLGAIVACIAYLVFKYKSGSVKRIQQEIDEVKDKIENKWDDLRK